MAYEERDDWREDDRADGRENLPRRPDDEVPWGSVVDPNRRPSDEEPIDWDEEWNAPAD